MKQPFLQLQVQCPGCHQAADVPVAKEPPMPRYDAIVIGSGQAGNPLSQKLADKGWTVGLIEKEHLGGTCINTGCTPTKTMIASAQVAHYARNAGRWGVGTGVV